MIFADTNKIYGSLRQYITLGKLSGEHTFLRSANGTHFKLYISDFVIEELTKIYERKQKEPLDNKKLHDFLTYTRINVSEREKHTNSILSQYVSDQNDVQIFADALYIDADIILTNNLKDFHCADIERDLALLVINEIPAELLE